MVDKATSHGLGIGNGSLIEHPDGSVEYRQTGKLLPAFRVVIQDVTGFSVRKVTRDDKKRLKASSFQQVLTVQGSGTTLAEAAMNYGTAEKIEAWFRAHASFGPRPTTATSPTSPFQSPASVADELRKLADLRDAGVLTADEFDQQKGRLLS